MAVRDVRGSILYPCVVMSTMAGADGRFTMPGVEMGATVVLLSEAADPSTLGASSTFYILGGIPHPNDSLAINVDGIKNVLAEESGPEGRKNNVEETRREYYINQDYKEVHLSDYHVQNLNSYINLSEVHGVTLRGSPRISFELDGDSTSEIFRFAVNGASNNRVLNAQSFLDRLFEHLDELHTKIDALETMINTINPALINVMNSTAVLLNAATPGSGAALIEQGIQVANAATVLSAIPQPQDTAEVRQNCERDKNPYIITP